MKIDLTGLDVVVTGGTGALGSAVVGSLAAAGARCHLPVRGAAPAAGRPPGGSISFREGVDLADERAVEAFYAALPALWASVHCAGGFAMGSVDETDAAALRAMLDVNLLSAAACCRGAVGAMRRGGRGGGRIVNVVSLAALEPRTGASKLAYTASKCALAGLTVALAEEVHGERILVNAVAPSVMDTRANRAAMPDADFSRWSKVEEVAATIAFLASPQNAVTRGAIVPV